MRRNGIKREIELTELHTGIYTHLPHDAATLTEYYTTVKADEVIMFYEGTTQRNLDETLIENCGNETMYILPLNGLRIVVIPAGESREINTVSLPGIKVLGALGQKIRYSGLFYEEGEA